MPFSSIKWTVLKCTDILIPVQPWDFLAFAKLWPYLVWANIQSILPSCLLFPNPPTSLPARYSWGSEHSARWFLPYQVLCGSNVSTVRQLVSVSVDEYQTVTPLYPVFYTSPCLACGYLFCYALKWIDVIALTQKSISTDLIIYIYIYIKNPLLHYCTLIISWIQRHIRGLSPFMINQKHLRIKALYLIPLNKFIQFHAVIVMATLENLLFFKILAQCLIFVFYCFNIDVIKAFHSGDSGSGILYCTAWINRTSSIIT